MYCPECAPQMAGMPQPRRKRVLVVAAVDSIEEIETCLAELAGICAEGGNHDGRTWFSGSFDRIARVDRGRVGPGKESGAVFVPRADGVAAAAFLPLSVEVGKLPSILGQEFFRSKVPSYSVSSFEDVVIFVHDVEHSLGKLDRPSQELIARVILQGFSHEEAGRLLGCCRRTVDRRLPEALDRLSEIFLAVGILKAVSDAAEKVEEPCQEWEEDENLVIM